MADGSTSRTLRVCALYPELMNIYADRGNLLLLERRCAWRSIGFQVTAASIGDGLDPAAHDLFYLGGGQDRDQRLCASDLVESKRDALHAAAADGRVLLGVCGGYQLLGHAYALGDEQIPGVGLVDLRTVREDGPRLIGNVAIEVELPGLDGPRVLAGFENHGGRTHLGEREQPLGRVLRGHGNSGGSGHEGVRRGNGDRHLPARSAAAQERLVRRLADRHGARARRAAGAARRPPRGCRSRRRAEGGRALSPRPPFVTRGR